MITIKDSSISLFSRLNTLLLFLVVNLLSAGLVRANDNDAHRREPIFPLPQSVAVNTAKALLGEKLFLDTRLSKNKQFACATCHQLNSGGDDNLSRGLSTSAESNVVNTPSIFNAQFNFRQNWDGSAKTLQQQIETAMQSPHQFDNSWENVIDILEKDNKFLVNFKKSYEDGITKNNIIDAIVEFEKTLITPDSRFDLYLRNEIPRLSKDEEQGYKLFKESGCISCHQGINVGGNLFQKFGVFYNYFAERGNITKSDYGRENITGRQIDAYVFKVPSLRNIALTAPYLHDGSAATLEEAITIMGRTQLGRTLTSDEVRLIKVFLQTLTGEYKNTISGAQL